MTVVHATRIGRSRIWCVQPSGERAGKAVLLGIHKVSIITPLKIQDGREKEMELVLI